MPVSAHQAGLSRVVSLSAVRDLAIARLSGLSCRRGIPIPPDGCRSTPPGAVAGAGMHPRADEVAIYPAASRVTGEAEVRSAILLFLWLSGRAIEFACRDVKRAEQGGELAVEVGARLGDRGEAKDGDLRAG